MTLTTLFLTLLVMTLAVAELRERTIVGGHGNGDDLAFVDHARVNSCGQNCKFSLCNFNGEEDFFLPQSSFAIFNAPKVASTPYICRTGEDLGLVLKSGEAKVAEGRRLIPISRWRPAGLKRSFRSTFIKTFKIPFLPRSGIGRLSSSANQWALLHDRCMTLPIRRYQRINKSTGRPTQIVNSSRKDDCVAFRTTAPAIQVMLTWDTPDDFDLEVTEPNGDILTFRNRRTEAGKLNGDNNVGRCDTALLGGRENVLHFPGGPIESGKYFVRVVHFKKCGSRPTNYQLRIVINGVQKTLKAGFSGAGNKEVVGTAAFKWP